MDSQPPVVRASFCRRFRPREWVEGLLAASHLNYLYSFGEMWEYQLQSTVNQGIHQTKQFHPDEVMVWPDAKPLPALLVPKLSNPWCGKGQIIRAYFLLLSAMRCCHGSCQERLAHRKRETTMPSDDFQSILSSQAVLRSQVEPLADAMDVIPVGGKAIRAYMDRINRSQ